ncbi:MAG: SnoaL-like polyketide cyclase, partial [Pseudonocardiales bacterium]|nr:SnoaL-like polyketide cyclase [Pseudonocardiales bacterium]
AMRQFFAGLPDAEAIEQDAAQDGDTVTMRFVVQGTHTGALWGTRRPATASYGT